MNRICEIFGGRLFPDAVRQHLDKVLNHELAIYDFQLLQGRSGEFAVILFSYFTDNEESSDVPRFSVSCDGRLVIGKLTELKEDNLLPIIGTIVKGRHYYDLV